MRQIALDTETTGIGHEQGHRIIEIGCIELVNRKFTGNTFHVYLNPEREVDPGAFRVHGISNDFLKDKSFFRDIASGFIEFIQGAELIIHNAPFDVGFLNSELKRLKTNQLLEDSATILDTLVMARNKHPGQKNTLDALCKRYSVDNSNRQFHGALLDAKLLAEVYLSMTGGQIHLFQEEEIIQENLTAQLTTEDILLDDFPVIGASREELNAHEDFVRFLQKGM